MNTGAVKIGQHFVKFGVPGLSDICGIIAPHGRFLAVECKSLTGRQSDQQELFQRVVERLGGVYVLCRSAEECMHKVRPYLPIYDQ